MRALSVVSELYPLVKTGGLADVAGALPPALARQRIEMRSLMPAYPAVVARTVPGAVVRRYEALLGTPAALRAVSHGDLALYLLEAPELFDRPGGPYQDLGGADHPDNWRRFAALARAAAVVARDGIGGFRPDLVHVHD